MTPAWKKSSYSNGNGGDCVELARYSDAVAVRDSKNPAGAVLTFGQTEMKRLLDAVKNGRFDG